MTITDEMLDAAAVALWGKPYRDIAQEWNRNSLRDAVTAVAPMIGAARLRAFADELMTRRDNVEVTDVHDDRQLGEWRGRKDGLEEAADLARAAAGEGGNGEAGGDRPTAAG